MGLGRAFYIILFPQIFSLAALVLSIVTFFSGYEHATGLRNVHYMTVDLGSINITGANAVLSALNVSNAYTVGTNGWCYGPSTSNITGCRTPNEPFYFDLSQVLEETDLSVIASQLPDEITQYDNISKHVSWGIWGAFLATMVLTFLQLFVGFLAICTRAGACCATLLSNLAALAAIIGAGLATGMYHIYTDKINEFGGALGIKASLDASGLGLAWSTVAAVLVADVLYLFASCCSSARKKRYVAVPEKESSFM